MPQGTPADSSTTVPAAAPGSTPPEKRTPAALRLLRRTAQLWWRVFFSLFAINYITSLGFVLLQGKWHDALDLLTSWGLLQNLEQANPPAFWSAFGALAVFAGIGFFEERAEKRSERLEQEEQRRKLAELTELMPRIPAPDVRPEPQPQGPPFDEGLLPPPPQFVGRAADLNWLLDRLGNGGPGSVTALSGMGGIGKTALAAEAVHRLRAEKRFPDGLAFVSCIGKTEPMEILRSALARFDPYRRPPQATALAELSDSAHQLLDHKDALVVLDNVEPELPLDRVTGVLRPTGVRVLLTTRQALSPAALPSADNRSLDLLSSAEALDLFAAYYGRGSAAQLAQSERAPAEHIVSTLDRHTLAVKLASATAHDTHRSLDVLSRELENPQRVFALSENDVPGGVQRAFASSLDALSVASSRLFAAFVAFATVEFGREAAIAVGKSIGLEAPESTLDTLVRRAFVQAAPNSSMPETADHERLVLHPLLRALAVKLAANQPEEEHTTVALALARYYAGYVMTFQANYPVIFADSGNIAGALRWVDEHGYDAEALVADGAATEPQNAAQMALATGRALANSGVVDVAQQFIGLSRRSFQNIGDRRGDGEAVLELGELAERRGRLGEAEQYMRESLRIAREPGVADREIEKEALADLGRMAQLQGRLGEAEEYLRESLRIARETQDRKGVAAALADLGYIGQWRGRMAEAEQYLSESLRIAREPGVADREIETVDLAYLGYLAEVRGQWAEAEDYYRQVFTLASAPNARDRHAEGLSFLFLGHMAELREEFAQAEKDYQQGLAIVREVQDDLGEGAALGRLGQLALAQGQLRQAGEHLDRALVIHQETHDRIWEIRTLCALARLAEANGDDTRAQAYYAESLNLAREADINLEVANVLLPFGHFLAERLGRREEGCPLIVEAWRRYTEMGVSRVREAQEVLLKLGCRTV